MNTLVLLVERESIWSPDAWVAKHEGKCSADGQVRIERESDWLSVIRDDRVLDDFDEDEYSRIGDLVTDPTTYLIEWKGSMLIENLLRSVPPETRVAVDNDHGLLVSVHEISDKPINFWVRARRLRPSH